MSTFGESLRKAVGEIKHRAETEASKQATTSTKVTSSASNPLKKATFGSLQQPKRQSQNDAGLEQIRSAYSALDTETKKRYSGLVQQALGSSAKTYSDDYNLLLGQYKRESSYTGYRSADSARMFNQQTSSQAKSLRDRADKYQKLMDIFGDDFDEDFRTGFSDMLTGTRSSISQMQEFASGRQDFFSQFADQKEYDAYQDMMSHYNAAKDAGKTTMQWYDDALSARDEADARFDEAQRRLADFENKSGELVFDPETGAFLGTRSDLGNDYSVEIENARADRDAAAKEKAERARDLYYADMFRYQDWQINDEDVLAGKEKMEVADAANQAISEMGRRIDYSNYAQTAGDLSYAEPLADQYKRDWSYKQPTDKWEQKDLDLYYSLFNSDPALADEYAIKINNQINSQAYAEKVKPVQEWMVREEGKWGRNIATGGAALAAGVATAPEDFFDYLDMMAQLAGRGVVMQKADPILADYADEMVSTRAKDLNDLGTIQSGWLEGKGLGDLYQLSESVLESITLGNLAGPLGTSAVFFGSAAKDALKSSLDSGASPKQAMIYSVVSGLNEAAWEYFSVDKMLSMKSPKNLAQFFGGLLTQGFVEGSEEFNTSLANSVAQAMILKDKSDIELNIQRYISEGMSYDEARKTAMKDWGKSLAADFAGGMISGMASGGVQQVGSSVRDSLTAVDDQSARDIIEYGREAGDPKARALAEKYQKRIEQLDRKGNPGKLSVAQYNKLDRTATESYVQGDIETTASAVEAKLKERGIEAPALARAIATEALRQEAERVGAEAPKLTREQKQLLNGNHMAEQILNDLDVGNLRNEASGGGFTYRDNSWVKEMKPTKLLAADVYGSQANTAENGSSVKADSKDSGVTYGGQRARIVGIENGKVQIEQGGTKKAVAYDELSGVPDGYGQIVQAAAERKNGTEMLRAYHSDQDPVAYIRAWDFAVDIFGAQTKATIEQARKSPVLATLTDAQLDLALAIGRQYALQAAQTAQRRADAYREIRKQAKKTEAKKGAVTRQKGTVSYKGGTFNGETYRGVDRSKLSRLQKKNVAMIERLADVLHYDFVVYEGEPNSGGVYLSGGTILVNIHAGELSGKTLTAASLSHELTHSFKERSPAEYEQLKDFIVSHILEKSPAQFEKLVQQQMDLNATLDHEGAVDELVANACQTMLRDSKAITQLARQNMTLCEKIVDVIEDLTTKIKEAFEGVDLRDDIEVYDAVRAIEDAYDEVLELWDKALTEATENDHAENVTGMKNPAPKSEVKMTWAGQTLQEYEAESAVRNALDHKDSGDDNLIKVGRMPKSIRDLSGIDGDFYVFRNHLYENIKSEKEARKENRYSKDAHYHAIGEQAAIDAIMALENPALVIDDSEGKENPQIVMVLPVTGKMGTPLVAAIGFYENEPINGKLSRRPHITLSIYEKLEGVKNRNGETYKSLAEFVDDAVENGKVIGYNKEISDGLPVIAKRSRLGNITESSLNNNLSQFRKNVNDFKKKNKINYQKFGIGETAEEREARRESISNLKSENSILRVRAKYWRDQTRQTRERTVRQQDTDRMANDLLREYESRTDKAEIKSDLKALGDYLVQAEELDYEELHDRAEDIADRIIDGNYTLIDDSNKENLDRLKGFLKGTALNLSASDFSDTGDEGFRKRYGRYFTVRENGRSIDSAWGELAGMFGEGLFPEDTYAPGDMLRMIGDYLDLWRPQYGNIFENARGEAVDAVTNEIIDRVLSEDVRQTPATYADKAQQKLNAQIAKDRARLDALREQKNARIEEIKREAAEKNMQIRLAEKAMKYEAVDKVKQHYRDMMQRQRGKRSDTALRGKIKKLHKELSDMLIRPMEKRYVPRELVKATAEILDEIDTTSGRAVKAKAALAELKVRYESLAKDDHYALVYDETVGGMIQELAENIGDGSIYDLTGSELEGVYNTLKALKHTIQTANKLVGAQIEADAFEAANQMMRETENAKGIPTKALRKFVMAQMTPASFFRMAGGYVKNSMWEQMFDMLNQGQLTQTQVLMEGGQIFRELIDDKKNLDTLHDQKNLVDIGLKDDLGNSIKITRGMMLSVYMHLQNEQNARHISYGGLTVPRLRQYYKNQMADAFNGKTGRAVAFATEIAELNQQLSEAETEQERTEIQDKIAELQEQTDAYMSDLRAQIEKQLTEYDRKWIAAAQKFFDEYSKNKLNEVTEMVYGFSKAQVDHYFPIHTDANYRAASFDTIVRDMSLENAGFMKERINGANPILLEDITDVISSQLRRTAQYVGLMPAIRNFNKAYGKARAGYSMSVQSAMARTFENEGKKYIENLMADLNGARKTEANIFDELRGNMAGAVLTLNPRVTLAQAASFPSAAAEIGYTPLMKALTDMKNPMWNKGLQDEIAKWTPLWWYRMQGYSTAELGDIKNNEQFMAKVMDKMKWATGWIQAADGLTTGGLWQASKYYVDENFSDLQKGSDEYMMKVAEVYNRVLEKTQPDYTTMQRPDILRNPNAIVKQLTMFMTQRLQNMNILYDAAATYSHYVRDMDKGRNGVTAADVKQAKTRLIWAVSSQVAASATIVIFKALADALMHSVDAYRDDDDELTAESVSKTMLTNFAETISGNILWGSEAFSWLKSALTGERYYGVSLNGVDTFTDMLSDGNKLIQKLIKGDLKDAGASAWKLTKAVSQFFGAPLGNAEKFVKMIVNNIEDARNGDLGTFEAGVERTRTQNTRLLFDALQAGDTKKAEKLKAEFKDEKDVRSALKTYIKQIYTEDKQIMKAEVITMLQRYCGMTRRNAENTATEWTMEVVTGTSYSKLGDEYIAGNIPKNTAIRYLQTYGGKTQAEAEQKISEWQCEKDTGIAYSDISNEVKIGNISRDRAIDMLVRYGSKDPDAAEKMVTGYLIEHEYGFAPADLQEEYLAGKVSDAEAFEILAEYKYFGKEDAEDKAADELERLQFVRANPGTEDISVTQVRNYRASGLEGFVSPENFFEAAKATAAMQGVDADGDGRIDSYSKVMQKLEYIDAMDLTAQQKTALARSLGINEKTIKRKAPWY